MDATLDFAVNLYFSKLNASNIKKNFYNLGKMRSNYLNFLELVLSSIESEVEFDVYRSFC